MRNTRSPAELHEAANTVYDAGSYELALLLYTDELALLNDVLAPGPSPERANALQGIGNCLELLRHESRAIDHWHSALQEYRQCGLGASAEAIKLKNALDNYDRIPLAFLSYAHNDSASVERIEQLLLSQKQKCQLIRDVRSFRAGTELKTEVIRQLDRCPNIILMWSKDYAHRPWPQFELAYVRKRTASDSPLFQPGRRAIIVALDKEPLPPSCEHLLMLKGNEMTTEALVKELLHALTGQRTSFLAP
jgi:tetratricopeptide (TPR) repeat protein